MGGSGRLQAFVFLPRNTLMGDLKNRNVIITKGLLFLFLGGLASTILLLRIPSLMNLFLHGVAVWAFCRFYYFAFYVIQNYVDPQFRFAGLWSFFRYLLSRSRNDPIETNARR